MTKPHDALAKLTFSRRELATEEILHALGPKLAARIDPTSLRQVPGSFVSEDMKDRESDMLYTAKLDGEEIFIYTLLEYQSKPERWMPLRVLGYKLGIWETFLRQHPRAQFLPIILTVVLYHGDIPWRWSTAFEALFNLPSGSCDELLFHIPRWGFVLDDLASQGEDQLLARPVSAHLRLVLLMLQYARSAPSLEALLLRFLDLIQEVWRSKVGRAALREVFCYLAHVRGRGERPELAKVAAALHASDQEDLMETIADMFINQGREAGLKAGREAGLKAGREAGLKAGRKAGLKAGREEGLKAGQAKVLLRLLRVRFGELPRTIVARVSSAKLEQLEGWTDRVLVASTLDELFASR